MFVFIYLFIYLCTPDWHTCFFKYNHILPPWSSYKQRQGSLARTMAPPLVLLRILVEELARYSASCHCSRRFPSTDTVPSFQCTSWRIDRQRIDRFDLILHDESVLDQYIVLCDAWCCCHPPANELLLVVVPHHHMLAFMHYGRRRWWWWRWWERILHRHHIILSLRAASVQNREHESLRQVVTIHTSMYIYIYILVCKHWNIYIYIHTYIHIDAYTYIYIHTCIHTCMRT